jgi:restriction system protein
MSIPDYQKIMLPLLKYAGDKKEHSIREAITHISELFNLTDEEKRELLPSGQQKVINNRTAWAKTYLIKAGLLESTRRSFFIITENGLNVLKENLIEIDIKYLEQFPEFVEFRTVKKDEKERPAQEEQQQTPQELLEFNYQKIEEELAREILKTVKENHPNFFERLVVELLLKMGYGGSRKDAGKAIGKSSDEGIDGIIKEDKLGLDTVYIQAKRWEGSVGRPEIQKFVGALHGQGAKKGIFITTSNFSKEAIGYASNMNDPKIVLIDGIQLANLMIDNDIGVSKVATYEIKKIDTDYFSEE